MSLYSRLDRLAADVEKLNRQVTAVANSPQSQRTSVEGGSIDFNDADGNLMAVVGGQDDGSNTIRHVDGPTPPVPSGLSAHVDGPIVQVSWDGSFESNVTHDWHYLEVLAVGPNDEQLTGTINDLSGGEASVAATSQGDWVITARSVSRAGKRSLDGDAGTVAVQLVGLTGAIDAVQESANGKNTIYYSPTEPTPPELGFNNGDLWFDTSEEGNNTASVWDGNGWVSMEDARLAAIIAAQEALETDLQDVQTSVDGKNTITWDPAAPTLSTPGKAVNDIWYRTSGNSIIGYWKWSGSAWVQQTLSATVIPQIDIGAGTFGTLRGARLEANSVSVDKLIVSPNANLISDSSFQADGAGWGGFNAVAVNPDVSFASVPDGPAGVTASVCRIAPTRADLTAATSKSWPMWYGSDPKIGERNTEVVPGDRFRFVLRARTVQRPASGIGKIRIRLGFNLNGESKQWPLGTGDISTDAPLGEWQTVTGEWAHPGGSELRNRLTVGIHSANAEGAIFEVAFVGMYAMVGSTLIQNGAITTDKLAVGSITAESGIIESLDLGKATVGELDGIRIMGQTVRGDQLSGDAIDGKVITGGTYRTTDGTGQWSDAGLFIAQPDGTSMVRFPTDGSPLSLTASDVQIERASIGDLDVSYGAVRSGGQLTLASGVTAPASPPELTTGWQKVASLQTPDAALTYDWLGLGYWAEGDGHWVRAVNVLGSEGDTLDEIHVYSMDGVLEQAIKTGLNPRSGVTVIGDVAYVMGPDYQQSNKGKQWVHGFDLNTGARVTRWEYAQFWDPKQAKVAIGNDGTNLVVAGVAPTRRLHVFRYNPTTGAQVSSWQTAPDWTGGHDLEGVHVAGSEVTILPQQTARIYTVSNNVLVRKTDSANANGYAGWDNPNRNGAGVVWRSTTPYVVDGAGDVYRGSAFTSDATVQMCFTWTNGTYETTPSPLVTFQAGAREVFTVSLPRRAGLSKRLYYRSGTSGSWVMRGVAEGTTVYVVSDVQGFAASLPTVNTFPNADPATLKSTNDKFEVKGDGSGHWGPLTFNTDGSLLGIPKMAVGKGETVTVTSGGFNTKTVTFPAGRFSTPPTVVVSANTTSEALINVGALTITKDGFTLSVRRTNSTPTGVDWIAMEVN